MIDAASFPKVSIIIPVYNGSNFLREAIDSALSQTYPNIEVLVINDGSNDDGATESIALSYDNRIRYYAKTNGGVSSALNFGIEQMRGDYFAWLSHDDVYKPEKVQRQVEFLQKSHNIDTIIYGGYELIDAKSKKIGDVDFGKLYPTSKLNVPLFSVFRGLANGCTMLIHKSHFERSGRFNEGLRTTQDYDLWFRMFRIAEVRFCPGLYVQSRVHSMQNGRTNVQHDEECDKLWIQMLDQVKEEEMSEMEGDSYLFYYRTAQYLKRHSNYRNAEQHARKLANEIALKLGKNHLQIGQKEPPLFMLSGNKIQLIRRLIQNVNQEGLSTTILKIKRKLGK
ncbi:Glycosyltransferase involved in cell wall bisynthesis [Paenibacillus sp. UNCCL117]|uniref:glycosyltransferase n=1 Tax=unclassified Paenibacillus TaxID=185978 RepID=UPI00087E7F07|nr:MULTISPECIES: glycosyltransferase [unclassified Paenibacillus]SDD91365.1 Glycosyltransferase involved in cell wall bisynthesis [Paenibacillus sp. cl123]SFW43725.1 Glycosyltransferase involved in cell wall bisynthesis [Paenibacillus sp. UNCCL117]